MLEQLGTEGSLNWSYGFPEGHAEEQSQKDSSLGT